MAGLIGGGSNNAANKPDYTGLQLQTSANGLAIPIVYGQTRLAPNLIWYGDFAAIKHQQTQGKGGDASSTTYTYQTAAMLALCEGPVIGVVTVWADKTVATLADLGMTLFTGTAPQAVWGYLASKHPGQALSYPSTALIAVSNYDLGSSAGLPNHNFEVEGVLWGTTADGVVDADPSAMILDYLTNPQYGLGFPAANIDLVSLQTGPASYKSYCQATGLWLSVALSDQEAARDTISRWLQLTNTAPFWSGDLLKFVPYGDEPLTANGASFVPDVTPIYDLDDDDLVTDGTTDPIIVTRKDPADCKNWVKLEILDRTNAYATDPIEAKDQAQIDLFTALPADQVTAHEICDPAVGAIAAQLILQRSVYVRNTYAFTLGWEYCLLEPMDIVTLTDTRLGMVKVPVRITSIEEDDQGNLSIEAEEFPAGIATATLYPKQVRTAYSTNYQVEPGPVNPPVILEPGAALVGNTPQVWVATSGGPNWGGCSVHLSLDNVGYDKIGEIHTPCRIGVLTAALGAIADPDTTSTLGVSLAQSPGATLLSGTQADADAGRTLIYVDGELMAYETAMLTGSSTYSLSYLRRGLDGTAVAAHAIGSQFARLDGNQFEYDLPDAYVGQTLYLKFTSFNIYGDGVAEEDISTVPAYQYVPNGKGSFIAPPTGVLLASNARTASDGTHILTLVGTWTASAGPLLSRYNVRYKTASATDWTYDQVPGNSTSYPIKGAVESTTYSFEVQAVSEAGYVSTWADATDANSGALTTTAPAAPTGLTVSAVANGYVAKWNANSEPDIQGYKLSAAAGVGSAFGSAVPVFQGDALTATVTGVGYEVPFNIWVQAYNIAGLSAPAGPFFIATGAYDGTIPPNSITDNLLSEALQGAIAQLTDPATVAGSIAAQIQQVAEAVSNVALSIADIQPYLQQVLAQVKSESTTYTDNATTAQASQTLALLSVVNGNFATLQANYTTVVNLASSASTAVTNLTAGFSGTLSQLQTQLNVTSTAATSATNDLNSLYSSFGGSLAALETSLSTTASNASAGASLSTTLNSQINGSGGLSASLSTLQSVTSGTNGLTSQYTVKVDVNGYVAGFGLASVANNGTVTSSFLIRADSFKIVNPIAGGQQITPFTVTAGSVFINDAYIQSVNAGKLTSGSITASLINIYSDGTGATGLNIYVNGTLMLGAGGFGTQVVGTAALQLGSVSVLANAWTAASVSVSSNTWIDAQQLTMAFTSGDTGAILLFGGILYDPGPASGGGGGGGGGGDAS